MKPAVFFDVGGTLLHPWPSVGAVYARVALRHGMEATGLEMDGAFQKAWRKHKRVAAGLTVSRRDWWEQLVADVLRAQGIIVSEAEHCEFFCDLYQEFSEGSAWEVYPDVVPTLAELRRCGVYVGLISNWDSRLRPLLEKLGLTEYFDALTISCEVGSEKPAAGIFQAALQVAQRDGAECWHVGDSLADDVAGAQAVGLRGLLIDRSSRAGDNGWKLQDLRDLLPKIFG